jgi:hypothetical protein
MFQIIFDFFLFLLKKLISVFGIFRKNVLFS